MNLMIQEIRWATNRVSGETSRRTTATVSLDAKVGEIKELSNERRILAVDAVDEDSVTLTVRYPSNPAADTVITVKAGESETYAPRSFGAGYIYQITLK